MKIKLFFTRKQFGYLLLNIIILSLTNCEIFAQYDWSPERKLTTGFYDSNPGFINTEFYFYEYSNFDLLIFERKHSETDSLSQICVATIDTGGIRENTYYLSDGSYADKNPCIYKGNNGGSGLYYALAVWESKRSEGSLIVGCLFDLRRGWGNPFIIDSTSDNHNPKLVSIDTINYSVVYQSGNDIIYRRIQARDNFTSYIFNLTSDDTSVCSNPEISSIQFSNKTQISYQHRRHDGNYSILQKTRNSNVWTNAEVISDKGDNRTSEYLLNYIGYSPAFESNRNGNWNIYQLGKNGYNVLPDINDSADNTSLQRFFNNIVTDGLIYSNAYAYKEEFLNEKRILFNNYGYPASRDTVIINSIENTGLTINGGLKLPNYDFFIWVVYNKDSAGTGSLYGKSVRVINTSINETGVRIPYDILLYQNYPNPFNPKTIINYSIPSNVKRERSNVKLIIYNAIGQEVS
ncbi:MAG: hypothetical protein ABI792_04880, partial [bacterium]